MSRETEQVAAERIAELERTIAPLTVDAAVEVLRTRHDAGQQNVQDLVEIATRHVQSDAAAARHALDIGERLAPEVGWLEAVPASLYLRARLTLNNGLPEEALELIAAAKSAWLELDRNLDAYRTELGRMHVLDDLGRHRDAVLAAEALLDDLDRFEVSGAMPNTEEPQTDEVEAARTQLEWIRAAANENLGVACGFTGQHQRALDAYRVAEERYEIVGGADDMARCRANRGVELVEIGRALDGLDVLQSALGMFDDLDDRLSYAQCLGHLADAELLLGLYAAALTRYEESRLILDGLEAKTEGCRIRLRIVRAYLALNLIDEAEVLAGQTEQLLAGLGLDHDLAEARWLCAVAQLRAGRPGQALDGLERAVDGAKASEDPPLLIKAMLTKSEALGELGELDGALRAAVEALAVVGQGNWPTEELHVRLRLAQLLDDSSEVESHLQRAEQLADDLGLPHLRYPVLLELGRHKRRQGGDAEARRWLRAAVDVVEGLRGLIPDEAVRTSYLEGRTAAHVDLMSMLIANRNATDDLAAFDLAEASKARTLADILAGVVQPNPLVGGAPSSTGIRRYEADLYAAYSALSNGGVDMTRTRRRAVQDRAIELEQAIRLAHLQAETHGPAVGDGSPPTAVNERPTASEQVLEYHVVGDEIVAFVWSNGELNLLPGLVTSDEIGGLVAKWDRRLRRFEMARQVGAAGLDRLVSNADQILRELWAALFGPALGFLDVEDPNLVIIPHGPLHAIPFHALIGPDGPLDGHWTITMAPSYAVAARLRASRWSPRFDSSLVLGVPDEAAPAVADEAAGVAEVLAGAELLVGADATVEALLKGADQPRDVIHLACHGLHRARNPMFSALKLADRWLTARDVLSLKLDGSLVVLSACETGRQGGQGSRDEALGLARSFLAAGASAVVVSLWLAGDNVTAELMHHFYQELQTGRSPASALQAARSSVAQSHPHPADWAPFVIHGGGEGES